MNRSMALALGIALAAGLGYQALAQDPAQTKQTQAPKAAAAPKAQVPPVSDPGLKDLNAQASYGFGVNIGSRLKEQCGQFQLDPKVVARGIADSLTAGKLAMTDEQIAQVMEQFEAQLIERQTAAMKAESDKNKAAGDAFLAANKQKPGVKTTASGLQYRVLKQGTGASPKPTDTVEINYKGTLIDGTVFDSTEGKGPLTNPADQFIDGWKEMLPLMKIGEKVEVVIPSDLAYGPTGNGPIGPNSVLVFEIELLGIK
jgi:FKBP-type peptidyl-prolyl cis-trans isomerase